MKKLGITLLFLGFLFGAASQESTNYLFGGVNTASGFGGLMTELSWVKDRPIYCMGGGGGVIINQSIFLGGYGMGNIVDQPMFTYLNTPVSFEFGHGGLWLGYNVMPKKVLHLSISSRFGWGGIGLFDNLRNELVSDGVFVITPQVNAEVNLLPFMKASFGGGYRAVLGLNNPFFGANDLNSPTVNFGLYFGWFGD